MKAPPSSYLEEEEKLNDYEAEILFSQFVEKLEDIEARISQLERSNLELLNSYKKEDDSSFSSNLDEKFNEEWFKEIQYSREVKEIKKDSIKLKRTFSQEIQKLENLFEGRDQDFSILLTKNVKQIESLKTELKRLRGSVENLEEELQIKNQALYEQARDIEALKKETEKIRQEKEKDEERIEVIAEASTQILIECQKVPEDVEQLVATINQIQKDLQELASTVNHLRSEKFNREIYPSSLKSDEEEDYCPIQDEDVHLIQSRENIAPVKKLEDGDAFLVDGKKLILKKVSDDGNCAVYAFTVSFISALLNGELDEAIESHQLDELFFELKLGSENSCMNFSLNEKKNLFKTFLIEHQDPGKLNHHFQNHSSIDILHRIFRRLLKLDIEAVIQTDPFGDELFSEKRARLPLHEQNIIKENLGLRPGDLLQELPRIYEKYSRLREENLSHEEAIKKLNENLDGQNTAEEKVFYRITEMTQWLGTLYPEEKPEAEYWQKYWKETGELFFRSYQFENPETAVEQLENAYNQYCQKRAQRYSHEKALNILMGREPGEHFKYEPQEDTFFRIKPIADHFEHCYELNEMPDWKDYWVRSGKREYLEDLDQPGHWLSLSELSILGAKWGLNVCICSVDQNNKLFSYSGKVESYRENKPTLYMQFSDKHYNALPDEKGLKIFQSLTKNFVLDKEETENEILPLESKVNRAADKAKAKDTKEILEEEYIQGDVYEPSFDSGSDPEEEEELTEEEKRNAKKIAQNIVVNWNQYRDHQAKFVQLGLERTEEAKKTGFKIGVGAVSLLSCFGGGAFISFTITALPVYILLGGGVIGFFAFVISLMLFYIFKRAGAFKSTEATELNPLQPQKEMEANSGLFDADLFHSQYNPQYNQGVREEIVKQLMEFPLSSNLLADFFINIRLGKEPHTIHVRDSITDQDEEYLLGGSSFEIETVHHLIRWAVHLRYPEYNMRNEVVFQVKHLAAMLDYTLKYPFKESIKRELIMAYLFAILNPQREEKNPEFNRALCYLVFQEIECFPDLLSLIYESTEPKNWYDMAQENSFSVFKNELLLALSPRPKDPIFQGYLALKPLNLSESALFELTLKNLEWLSLHQAKQELFEFIYRILRLQTDPKNFEAVVNAYDRFWHQQEEDTETYFEFFEFLQDQEHEETLTAYLKTPVGWLTQLEIRIKGSQEQKAQLVEIIETWYKNIPHRFESLMQTILNHHAKSFEEKISLLKDLFSLLNENPEIQCCLFEQSLKLLEEKGGSFFEKNPLFESQVIHFIQHLWQTNSSLNKEKVSQIYNRIEAFVESVDLYRQAERFHIIRGTPREKIKTLLNHLGESPVLLGFLSINEAYTALLFPGEKDPDRRDSMRLNQEFYPLSKQSEEDFLLGVLLVMPQIDLNDLQLRAETARAVRLLYKNYPTHFESLLDQIIYSRGENPNQLALKRLNYFFTGLADYDQQLRQLLLMKSFEVLSQNPSPFDETWTAHEYIPEFFSQVVILLDGLSGERTELRKKVAAQIYEAAKNFLDSQDSEVAISAKESIHSLYTILLYPTLQNTDFRNKVDKLLNEVSLIEGNAQQIFDFFYQQINLTKNPEHSSGLALFKAQEFYWIEKEGSLRHYFVFLQNFPKEQEPDFWALFLNSPVGLLAYSDFTQLEEPDDQKRISQALTTLYQEHPSCFESLLIEIIHQRSCEVVETQLMGLNYLLSVLDIRSFPQQNRALKALLQHAFSSLLTSIEDVEEFKRLLNVLMEASPCISDGLKLQRLSDLLEQIQGKKTPIRQILIHQVLILLKNKKLFEESDYERIEYIATFSEQVVEGLKEIEDKGERRRIYKGACLFLLQDPDACTRLHAKTEISSLQGDPDSTGYSQLATQQFLSFLEINEAYTQNLYPEIKDPDMREAVRRILKKTKGLNEEGVSSLFRELVEQNLEDERKIFEIIKAHEIYGFRRDQNYQKHFGFLASLRDLPELKKILSKISIERLLNFDSSEMDQVLPYLTQALTQALAEALIHLYTSLSPHYFEDLLMEIMDIKSKHSMRERLEWLNALLRCVSCNKEIPVKLTLLKLFLKEAKSYEEMAEIEECLIEFTDHMTNVFLWAREGIEESDYEQAKILYERAKVIFFGEDISQLPIEDIKSILSEDLNVSSALLSFLKIDEAFMGLLDPHTTNDLLNEVNKIPVISDKDKEKFHLTGDFRWVPQEKRHLITLLAEEKFFLAGKELVGFFKTFNEAFDVPLKIQAVIALVEYAKKPLLSLKEQRIIFTLLKKYLKGLDESHIEHIKKQIRNLESHPGERNLWSPQGLPGFLFQKALSVVKKVKEDYSVDKESEFNAYGGAFKACLKSEKKKEGKVEVLLKTLNESTFQNPFEGYSLIWDIFLNDCRYDSPKVFTEKFSWILSKINSDEFPYVYEDKKDITHCLFNVIELKLQREQIEFVGDITFLYQVKLLHQVFFPLWEKTKKLRKIVDEEKENVSKQEDEMNVLIQAYEQDFQLLEFLNTHEEKLGDLYALQLLKKELFFLEKDSPLTLLLEGYSSWLINLSHHFHKSIKMAESKVRAAMTLEQKQQAIRDFTEFLITFYQSPQFMGFYNFWVKAQKEQQQTYLDNLKNLLKSNPDFDLGVDLQTLKENTQTQILKQKSLTEKKQTLLCYVRLAKLAGFREDLILKGCDDLFKSTNIELDVDSIYSELMSFELYSYLKSETFESDKMVIALIQGGLLAEKTWIEDWSHLFLKKEISEKTYYFSDHHFEQDPHYLKFEALCAKMALRAAFSNVDAKETIFLLLEKFLTHTENPQYDRYKCTTYIQYYAQKHWPKLLQEKVLQLLRQPKVSSEKEFNLGKLGVKCSKGSFSEAYFDYEIRAHFMNEQGFIGSMEIPKIAAFIRDLSFSGFSFFPESLNQEKEELLERFLGSLFAWVQEAEIKKGSLKQPRLGVSKLKKIYYEIEELLKRTEMSKCFDKRAIKEAYRKLGDELDPDTFENEEDKRGEYLEEDMLWEGDDSSCRYP